MFQKAFGDTAMSAVQINVSKVVKHLLKVIHVPEGLQQAEPLKMLNGYKLETTKISD